MSPLVKWATVEEAIAALPTIHTGGRSIQAVILHHTWEPSHADWTEDAGVRSMLAFWKARQKREGWKYPTGGHYVVGPDGTVWAPFDDLSIPLNADSNLKINHVGVAIETVGNFDTGHDTLEGPQRHAVIGLMAGLCHRFGLGVEQVMFHRDFTNEKTCPGTSLSRGTIRMEVQQAIPWVISLGMKGCASTG